MQDIPDYGVFIIILFLRDAIEDEDIPLPNFYDFCKYLKIPLDVRALAKNLLKAKGDKLIHLKPKQKFNVYCASFFVAYVMTREDYSEYKKNFKEISRILSQNDFFIEYRVKIGKFLSTIFDEKFHGYLSTDALDEEEKYEFYRKFYKIELEGLFVMLKKKNRRIKHFIDFDEFIDAFFYVMEMIYEDYEYSAMRICTISYYILTKVKNFKTIITSNCLFSCTKVTPEITRKTRFKDQEDTLLRNQFEDKYNEIVDGLNYNNFTEKFPKLDLINNDKEDLKKSSFRLIKERLKRRRWRDY